jgi:undecaprenyl diphosphate synthase
MDDGAVRATRIPQHVAIIMDGNGRWAAQRGLPRAEGHRRGVEAVREVVAAAADFGIGYLTLFSFSSENWSRPPSEVAFLMGLLRRFIRRDLADLHSKGVRIRIMGERSGVEDDIVGLLFEAETLTAANSGLNLNIAFNYGARTEITRAVKGIAERVERGELKACDVDQTLIGQGLYNPDMPDPDLLVRTSGELRLSNFLLWQLAYAELVFTPVLWPDFRKEHLRDAIVEFQGRNRRYGGLGASTADGPPDAKLASTQGR